MATAANPLSMLAWPGQSGVNIGGQLSPQSGMPLVPTPPGPAPGGQLGQQGLPGYDITTGGPWGNPLAVNHPLSQSSITANLGGENIIAAQLKNQLAPLFANLMTGYAQPAGQLFGQLANLGSPYYQQQQAQTFGQGVQQGQAATGQARQQLGAAGYGYTPSGAEAGMLGGMGMQEAMNLNQNFLANLFQNEQMQLQGAQGLAGLASLFQPQGFLGGTSTPFGQSSQSALQAVLQGFGQLFGGYGQGLSGAAAAAAT